MSNTTPVPSPAQSPATPAGQTTVFPTVAPDPAAQPAPIPVPKPKRKLPRWIWSVGGGIVAAILFWIARDVLLFLIVVAVGFITGPKVRSMIRSWKQERERKAAMVAAAAGQPTVQTTQSAATFSSGWRSGARIAFAMLFGALGGLIGWIAVWGIIALVLRFSEFWIPSWAPYALGTIAAAIMFIVFGVLGNKVATKLL